MVGASSLVPRALCQGGVIVPASPRRKKSPKSAFTGLTRQNKKRASGRYQFNNPEFQKSICILQKISLPFLRDFYLMRLRFFKSVKWALCQLSNLWAIFSVSWSPWTFLWGLVGCSLHYHSRHGFLKIRLPWRSISESNAARGPLALWSTKRHSWSLYSRQMKGGLFGSFGIEAKRT